MKKIGIIRCQQTEGMCPGNTCFKAVAEKFGVFKDLGDVELMGFVSCGGCPGKRAVLRAKRMVGRGAEVIIQASCITKGTPIDFPCPFAEEMRAAIKRKIGETIQVLTYSH